MSDSSSASPKFSLHYWDGRGLMEVPRMMLALAGRFPKEGAYSDNRYTTETPADGSGVKSYVDVSKKLTANLGRMPLLSIDGTDEAVGQSAGINTYVALECGFMGKNHFEQAQVTAIVEHVKEMMTAYRGLIPYGQEPTEELLTKWFTTGAEDMSPENAASTGRSERFAKWWFGRIESTLTSSQFAVGNSISLADVVIYNTFAELLKDDECPTGFADYRKQPFGNASLTAAALKSTPKLSGICANVRSQPQVEKWLSTRGLQKF